MEGQLPLYIKQFLQARKIQVNISGSYSQPLPVSSGVPQGAVVSPTLFNIMINDLFDNCPVPISCSLYADDGAMWIVGQDVQTCANTMQIALRTLEEWSHLWGLHISPLKGKTVAMVFSRKRRSPSPNLLLHNQPLEYVTNHKFLGMILDRKLSWANHIKSLGLRCQRDLRLLSIISSRNFGADAITIRRIYIALVRPKIDYGSFLYSTAAKSHLKTLDRIQYSACRTIIGALKCTPTNCLEAEANLIPLERRRTELMLRYSIRTLGTSGHPFSDLIKEYYHFQFYENSRLPLPVTGRIYKAFLQHSLTTASINTYPLHQRIGYNGLETGLTLAEHRKDDLGSKEWASLFADLHSTRYQDRVAVFCDGSVKSNSTGCAVWSKNFQIVNRMHDNTSVFAAEMFAIYIAVTYLALKQGDFIIYSDSKSSLTALRQISSSKSYIAHNIYKCLKQLPDNKIILEWVPSHRGIFGNEKADMLANISLTQQQRCSAILAQEDAINLISTSIRKQWHIAWTQSQSKLLKFKPNILPLQTSSFSRADDVRVTRLRLECSRLTHGHLFNKTARAQCSLCNVAISHQHVIIDCPKYSIARGKLASQCQIMKQPVCLQTVLSPNFKQEILILFLKETDLINAI